MAAGLGGWEGVTMSTDPGFGLTLFLYYRRSPSCPHLVRKALSPAHLKRKASFQTGPWHLLAGVSGSKQCRLPVQESHQGPRTSPPYLYSYSYFNPYFVCLCSVSGSRNVFQDDQELTVAQAGLISGTVLWPQFPKC